AQANLAAITEEESVLPSVTLKTKQDSVVTYQETQEQKKAALESTLADLDITIRLKENDISQKSASLTKLYKTLDDYRITAPFDGTVRRVDYQVGDNLLADTTEAKYIVLENRDSTIITILLDQVDIVRVKTGQPATLTLDAIPGRSFSGSIFEIDPTPVQSSGVVSYNVSVRMPTPDDLTILSGMTATVNIETARKENVLAVPSLSLLWKNSAATLQRADGQTVPVETGLTDGRYTEILSGANEGESILAVHVATTGSANSAGVDPGQLMRLSGGFGGMPAGGGRTGTR
ncbi:MAG: efflux RND transporter periplasmic adaptor subunit, partial [Candidatus Peribacteraceae bacterium]|nr:efflux RND transporter periplasmic adaptor subunit [Candidatus Peribacteraceae bacterium]